MSRRALIEDITGDVKNVIELKDGVTWSPPVGHSIQDADANAEPGGHWDGLVFTRKPIVPPDPDVLRLHDLGQQMVSGPVNLVELQEFLVLRHKITLDEII